jgi:hypothetical protein
MLRWKLEAAAIELEHARGPTTPLGNSHKQAALMDRMQAGARRLGWDPEHRAIERRTMAQVQRTLVAQRKAEGEAE